MSCLLNRESLVVLLLFIFGCLIRPVHIFVVSVVCIHICICRVLFIYLRLPLGSGNIFHHEFSYL